MASAAAAPIPGPGPLTSHGGMFAPPTAGPQAGPGFDNALVMANLMRQNLGRELTQINVPEMYMQLNDAPKVLQSIWNSFFGMNYKLTDFSLNDITEKSRGDELTASFRTVDKPTAATKFNIAFKGEVAQFDSWEFTKKVLPPMAKRATGRESLHRRIAHTRTMQHFGERIELPMDFPLDPTKMLVAQKKIENLNENIHLTWVFRTVETIYDEAVGGYCERHREKMNGPMNHNDFEIYMHRRRDAAFALQKGGSGIEGVETLAVQNARERNVALDVVWMTMGSQRFMTIVRENKRIYADRGNEIFNKTIEVVESKNAVRTPIYGMRVHESRPFPLQDRLEPRDPTVYATVVSLFFIMSAKPLEGVVDNKCFSPERLTIEFVDASSGKYERFAAKTAFEFSGIFNPRGTKNLTQYGPALLEAICKPEAGSKNTGTPSGVPFDPTGADVNAAPYFGQTGGDSQVREDQTMGDNLPRWINAWSLVHNTGTIARDIVGKFQTMPKEQYSRFEALAKIQQSRGKSNVQSQTSLGFGAHRQQQQAQTYVPSYGSTAFDAKMASQAFDNALDDTGFSSTIGFGAASRLGGTAPKMGVKTVAAKAIIIPMQAPPPAPTLAFDSSVGIRNFSQFDADVRAQFQALVIAQPSPDALAQAVRSSKFGKLDEIVVVRSAGLRALHDYLATGAAGAKAVYDTVQSAGLSSDFKAVPSGILTPSQQQQLKNDFDILNVRHGGAAIFGGAIGGTELKDANLERLLHKRNHGGWSGLQQSQKDKATAIAEAAVKMLTDGSITKRGFALVKLSVDAYISNKGSFGSQTLDNNADMEQLVGILTTNPLKFSAAEIQRNLPKVARGNKRKVGSDDDESEDTSDSDAPAPKRRRVGDSTTEPQMIAGEAVKRTPQEVKRLLCRLRLSDHEFFHLLFECNVPLPFSFIIWQLYIRLRAGCCLFLKEGDETAVHVISEQAIILQRVPDTYNVNIISKFSQGLFVRERKNLEFVPHTYSVEYNGGGSHVVFDVEKHLLAFQNGRFPADVWVTIEPYWWQQRNCFLDFAGGMNPRMYTSPDMESSTTHPTAQIYRAMLDVRPGTDNDGAPDYFDPAYFMMEEHSRAHTLAVQGKYRIWEPHPDVKDRGTITREIPGFSPFGRDAQEDVFEILRGGREFGRLTTGRR